MERETSVKIGWFKNLPSWIQTAVSVGGLIFAFGVMYNDVQTVKSRVDKYDSSQVEQVRMSGEITNLQIQISQSNETQKQTNEAVIKLADSINGLGISVAKLQAKLDR